MDRCDVVRSSRYCFTSEIHGGVTDEVDACLRRVDFREYIRTRVTIASVIIRGRNGRYDITQYTAASDELGVTSARRILFGLKTILTVKYKANNIGGKERKNVRGQTTLVAFPLRVYVQSVRVCAYNV